MTNSDHDFSELGKLLRAKKYEQPPPGYFHSFSDKVIARIQAEEVSDYSSWWSWMVERFDARPALVCAYGLAVSAMLFSGFRLSQAFEAELGQAPTLSAQWLATTPTSPLLLHQHYAEELAPRRMAPSALPAGWHFPAGDSLTPAGSLQLPVNWTPSGR
jgi:hypothetical protein